MGDLRALGRVPLVLVIEDDQTQRQMLLRMLESAAYEAVGVGDGETGLRAVVGCADGDELVKPKAFVVPRTGREPADEAAAAAFAVELQSWVKSRLAPYKYPRWVEIVAELPKTATGKIQRFKLRRP